MTKSLDHEPSEDSNPAEDYDYVSDSDLEVDEVAEPAMKANNPLFGTPKLKHGCRKPQRACPPGESGPSTGHFVPNVS